MPLYDIKITPLKEKNIAQISLLLKDSAWKDYEALFQKIGDSLAKEHLLKKELSDPSTLLLEITYGELEAFSNTLESVLSSDATLKLSKKQIYILKLGGWFDF